jgi:hypothetical protein
MGPIKHVLWWAGSAARLTGGLLLVGIGLSGCDSTPNDGDGNGAQYNLVVVLEKNLDSGQDVIYVRFRKDGVGISGGVVVIDADTIATSSASGQGNKTYTPPRWQHGEKIQVAALDTSGPFVYRDSVVIPDELNIDNVLPANRIWRPIDGNAQVSWTTSIGAVNYAISVRARTSNTPSRGLSAYSQSQMGLSQEIPPSAFRDQFDNLVQDVYDLKIIAYSPNFIARPNPPYKTPPGDDVRTPILKTNIDGGIAALVVSGRDTLLVQTQ